MDGDITRIRAATLAIVAIAILVVAAVGMMKSPIMKTTGIAISIVAIAINTLFFGPGPPATLRSVKNAIIHGAGTEGRKARTFLKNKSTSYTTKYYQIDEIARSNLQSFLYHVTRIVKRREFFAET